MILISEAISHNPGEVTYYPLSFVGFNLCLWGASMLSDEVCSNGLPVGNEVLAPYAQCTYIVWAYILDMIDFKLSLGTTVE